MHQKSAAYQHPPEHTAVNLAKEAPTPTAPQAKHRPKTAPAPAPQTACPQASRNKTCTRAVTRTPKQHPNSTQTAPKQHPNSTQTAPKQHPNSNSPPGPAPRPSTTSNSPKQFPKTAPAPAACPIAAKVNLARLRPRRHLPAPSTPSIAKMRKALREPERSRPQGLQIYGTSMKAWWGRDPKERGQP